MAAVPKKCWSEGKVANLAQRVAYRSEKQAADDGGGGIEQAEVIKRK